MLDIPFNQENRAYIAGGIGETLLISILSILPAIPIGFILGTRAEDDCSVDCYIITRESLETGSIVECEPIGLLEQDEDGEIDHKVLASQPNQHVELTQELLQEMQGFIRHLFALNPDMHVTVGNILPREEALRHMQELREDYTSGLFEIRLKGLAI